MEKQQGGHDRMIIAIDMDCVLNNLMDKTLEIYNAQNGKNIQMSDLTSYNFYDCLNKKDADGVIKLFKNKSLWDSLTPIKGAKEGLQKLINAGHRIYIVTATAPENWLWKITWLKKYFSFFNTENVISMVDKSLFKCDVLIEDCLEQLIKHKSCHRVCLDYPWNRDTDDFIYDIHRCKNWDEILEAVNEIEKERLEWEKK